MAAFDYANCTTCGAPVLKVEAHRFLAGQRHAGTYCSVSCCPRCSRPLFDPETERLS